MLGLMETRKWYCVTFISFLRTYSTVFSSSSHNYCFTVFLFEDFWHMHKHTPGGGKCLIIISTPDGWMKAKAKQNSTNNLSITLLSLWYHNNLIILSCNVGTRPEIFKAKAKQLHRPWKDENKVHFGEIGTQNIMSQKKCH